MSHLCQCKSIKLHTRKLVPEPAGSELLALPTTHDKHGKLMRSLQCSWHGCMTMFIVFSVSLWIPESCLRCTYLSPRPACFDLLPVLEFWIRWILVSDLCLPHQYVRLVLFLLFYKIHWITPDLTFIPAILIHSLCDTETTIILRQFLSQQSPKTDEVLCDCHLL